MSDFKEFQGKDLDEAIESACDYYNLKRDRLEIEILGGGSTGIFGIMGVKKAKVKARPRAQVNASDILNGDGKRRLGGEEAEPAVEARRAPEPESTPESEVHEAPEPGNAIEPEYDPEDDVNGNVIEPEYDPADDINGNIIRPEGQPRQPRERRERGKGGRDRDRKPRESKGRGERSERGERGERSERSERGERGERGEKPRRDRDRKPPRERKPRVEVEDDYSEERPAVDMSEFDPAVLEGAVREVMTQLLTPIVGETKIEVTIESDRVKVFIDDEENSGLIIGREGQTLSSLQYLVNRLVSRKMEASVRIQVDTGDYRERQDDKLRQIALHLAEKAADLGRTQSTKPLSSYHRRVVHLSLQENEDVFTRSKGDGPMKRVLIVPKNRKNGSRSRY